MSVLLDLASKCKAATGPDREIDGWIWAHLKRGERYIVGQKEGRFPRDPIYGERLDVMEAMPGKDAADYIGAPEFTASLDAAMTLAPDGHVMSGLSQEDTDNPQRKWAAEYRRGFKTSYDKAFPARAATGPLALCAAALRARAAEQSALNREGGNG